MSQPKIAIVAGQRFGCIRCGACCRRWHVALMPGEAARLRALRWPAGGWTPPGDPVTSIGGHAFVAHTAEGNCIFLDPSSNLCRIHGVFGERAKPLGCRVYPLNIASTWWGEVSVTARMDCPAVQRNHGRPLRERSREIAGYVRELGIRNGFSERETGGVSPQSIRFLADSIRERIVGAGPEAGGPARRSLAFLLAVRRFEALGVNFLNDYPTLREVTASFFERTFQWVTESVHGPIGPFWRAVFRVWLAQYLRRDEEVLGRGFGARFRRMTGMAAIAMGRGSFGVLGAEHPGAPLRKVPLFPGGANLPGPPPSGPGTAESAAVWECYYRFLDSRLSALQFFGATYYGASFFGGLRALAQTYPFVLAAARASAADRGASRVGAEDVQYAVGAIDHGFGRSKLLERGVFRRFEALFSGVRFGRLLAAMNWE